MIIKRRRYKIEIMIFAITIALSLSGVAAGQIQSAGGGYYRAGYPTIYGSFGQASAAQSRMYTTMQTQTRKTTERNALIEKWGLAAVEKAEREAASGAPRSARSKLVLPAPAVVRNHGTFRPDPSVDSGKALADALASTPEEKALIRQIYTATKAAYDEEAAVRGWQNNIAAGLTFFTVAAITVYHDTETNDDAVKEYFKVVNSSLDEIPEFGSVSNKDKQGFNNMLIGFGGMMLATYTEAKLTNNAETLSISKKLAAMLIEMVLKADPEKLRVANNRILLD